ncbi:MAG: TPM domain-containing protein, partial [Treponema sp.]|nr:TPM domain-containing protein [Treponema sp.]
MKKFLNILCLALFASFATLPLYSQSEDGGIVEVDQSVGTSSSAKAYLVDDAMLLSSPQAQALEQKLSSISERYDCDVVVVTKTNISGSNVTGYA